MKDKKPRCLCWFMSVRLNSVLNEQCQVSTVQRRGCFKVSFAHSAMNYWAWVSSVPVACLRQSWHRPSPLKFTVTRDNGPPGRRWQLDSLLSHFGSFLFSWESFFPSSLISRRSLGQTRNQVRFQILLLRQGGVEWCFRESLLVGLQNNSPMCEYIIVTTSMLVRTMARGDSVLVMISGRVSNRQFLSALVVSALRVL